MTDPEIGWDADSIKQVHVFTDIDYHHSNDSYDYFTYDYWSADISPSIHPPLEKWTYQPPSLYTYYERGDFGEVRLWGC